MAPDDIKFNDSGNEAWVTFRGSWDRTDPVGYKLSVCCFFTILPLFLDALQTFSPIMCFISHFLNEEATLIVPYVPLRSSPSPTASLSPHRIILRQ